MQCVSPRCGESNSSCSACRPRFAGAGKTLIAAEVIRRKLPALKAATKAVLFMAPTNPLVAQVRLATLAKHTHVKIVCFAAAVV